MSPNKIWPVSVHELLQIFRDSLLAMIRIADKAHMPWKEPESYDDWDRICIAIYESIVIRSVECGIENRPAFPIPEYDKRIASYGRFSFITERDSIGKSAFICFESASDPFDTCLFANLDDNWKVIGFPKRSVQNVVFLFAERADESLSLLENLAVTI